MEIRTDLEFPADPHTVFAMLIEPEFLEEVAAEAGAREVQVNVEGTRTTSRRVVDAPAQAQKFTGPDIIIVEELVWGPARPDGSRTGVLTLASPGQPLSMEGSVELRPGGRGTQVTVSGELSIKIPLVGKKMEQMAAPAIRDGIRAEERVGLRRLARA